MSWLSPASEVTAAFESVFPPCPLPSSLQPSLTQVLSFKAVIPPQFFDFPFIVLHYTTTAVLICALLPSHSFCSVSFNSDSSLLDILICSEVSLCSYASHHIYNQLFPWISGTSHRPSSACLGLNCDSLLLVLLFPLGQDGSSPLTVAPEEVGTPELGLFLNVCFTVMYRKIHVPISPRPGVIPGTPGFSLGLFPGLGLPPRKDVTFHWTLIDRTRSFARFGLLQRQGAKTLLVEVRFSLNVAFATAMLLCSFWSGHPAI